MFSSQTIEESDTQLTERSIPKLEDPGSNPVINILTKTIIYYHLYRKDAKMESGKSMQVGRPSTAGILKRSLKEAQKMLHEIKFRDWFLFGMFLSFVSEGQEVWCYTFWSILHDTCVGGCVFELILKLHVNTLFCTDNVFRLRGRAVAPKSRDRQFVTAPWSSSPTGIWTRAFRFEVSERIVEHNTLQFILSSQLIIFCKISLLKNLANS